jgi:hypothetical protein
VLASIQNKMVTRLLSDPDKAQRVMEFIETGVDATSEQILELFGDDIGIMAEVGEQLFTYCAGWGVTESPPRDADELLEMLGILVGKTRLRRASWVRSLLSNQKEANALVQRVMELSQDGSRNAGS